MDKRIVVIGAGPTGIGAAWRLNELGHDNWLLFERESRAGGLSASFVDGKNFTWDIGGHVLFSHYDYFDDLMEKALGDRWVDHERESWIWIFNRFVPYPFQNNIRHLPREAKWDCVRGLLKLAERSDTAPEKIRNFRDWLLAGFGEGLTEHFLFPYNWKVWAWPAEEMDYRWTGDRVAAVNLERILDNIINEKDDVGWGPNQTFRFPLNGGTGAIWRSLADQLPQDKIKYGASLIGVDPEKRVARFSNGDDAEYDYLISTVPVDRLVEMAGLDDLCEHAGRLEYSATDVFGYGIAGEKPPHLKTKCWMYFPESNCPFFRVTVFSNYSPNNVPDAAKYWSLMAEVSHSRHRPVDDARVEDEVTRGLIATKLLPEDAEVVSLWNLRADRGYPVPALGRNEALAAILPALEEHDIYSRGRFGAWKYEVGNMDHSAMQGVEVVDRLLSGGREPTLNNPDQVNAPRK